MLARALLIIAVFAGLLGGQLGARGVCSPPQACSGCCAPGSDASCCRASEKPAPPVSAPVASHALDWKMVVQPRVVVLPRSPAGAPEKPCAFSRETLRALGLARIELTCVRLI